MKLKASVFRVTAGDVGGITYSVANNIVNYLIVIATLTFTLGWPNEIVFGRVIPGMSIGLMAGGFYYAWMAHKLNKKRGSIDATALPSGVSTPAMFVMLYGVIMPLHWALGDPELAWSAAVCACFIGGFIEFCGGFIGPWIRKALPRAALLGTVAGIGFIWMATQGVFDVFGDPVIGLPILIVALVGLFGGYVFPKKIPPLVVAVVGGIVYALLLGRTHFDFTGIGFYCPNPVTAVQGILNGFAVIAPYLTIVIPIEIYNFIETMDNVESAHVAGDSYSVREAQFADGICTMISACCGGTIPNTVWMGHASLKKAKATASYSWISGLILGAAGIFGLFTFLSKLVPPAICAVTFLWCAIVMLAQAFKACPVKHYAAIGIAMIPSIADYLYTQVTGAVGLANIWTEILPSGLSGYNPEVTQQLISGGVMWNGVPAVKAGAILIGLILGAMTVFIIDKQLHKVGILALAGAVLSMFGFIHSAALGFYPTSPFVIGYVVVAVICFILHSGRNSWFKGPDDFEYV